MRLIWSAADATLNQPVKRARPIRSLSCAQDTAHTHYRKLTTY